MTWKWWHDAVVYQIYPRSFASADADGVGDLGGIRSRLAHVADLGADAVWLSPFFRSPMKDFGYDVSDYCDVDPVFGSLADFDAVVAEAHRLGLRVIIDWVPNHTSDQHPWFVESRSSRDNPKRDWYIWKDAKPDGSRPNNWTAAWQVGPAWTWDDATQQYYLHLFLPEQPDLNWANPEVIGAMHATLRFWLDRGVDGFRMDVLMDIGKDPDRLDDWPETGHRPDPPFVHDRIREIRRLLDGYDGDRMAVGEIFILDSDRVAAFYGDGDELHLCFNFRPLFERWDADRWRRQIDRTLGAILPVGWPTWVLSNHDVPRHRTRYGSEARARAALFLLLGLPGTPFLYAGEELGLEDADVPGDRVVDPGGRDGCRAPIPWDGTPEHGWGTADPWLPWPPESDTRHVAAQAADAGSVLALYKAVLALRRQRPSLRRGTFSWVDAPDGVLAWERSHEGEVTRVAVNFTGARVALDWPGWSPAVSSDGTSTLDGLAPDGALIASTTRAGQNGR